MGPASCWGESACRKVNGSTRPGPTTSSDRLALACSPLNHCVHPRILYLTCPHRRVRMPHCTSTALAVALTTGLLACGGDKGSVDTATANPLSQLTSAGSSIQKMSNSMAATANRKPVAPVSYKVLLDYLPRSIDGMKADEPKGETTAYGEWQYSSAEGRYHSEDGNKSVKVGLFDYAHIPLLYAPFQMIMN